METFLMMQKVNYCGMTAVFTVYPNVWGDYVCGGTGFWKCNMVFDCDDGEIGSVFLRRQLYLDCILCALPLQVCGLLIMVFVAAAGRF